MSEMNVREKLNIVQSKLVAPKGQRNNFGNYNYRSNEDILEAVKPLLGEVGAVITQSDAISLIGDRFYLVATSCFTCCESGDEITNTAYAREPQTKKGMDEAQITGATSSYARKYSLNGLLLIDDSRDADTMDNSHSQAPAKPQQQQQGDDDNKEWLNDISGIVKAAKDKGWDAPTAIAQGRKKYKISKKVAAEIEQALF